MTWYMVPAIIGISIKLWLLMTARNHTWVSKGLVGFVAVFALHNLSELLILVQLSEGIYNELRVRIYFICVIAVLVYANIYVMDKTKYSLQKTLVTITATLGILLALLILLSNGIISGYSELSYTVVAIKGDYFILFKVYALSAIILLSVILFYNYIHSEDNPTKQLSYAHTIKAFTPLLLVTIAIVALTNTDYQINAAVIMPIASTFFLIMIIRGKNIYLHSNDPRTLIPFSLESDVTQQLNQALTQYCAETISHKEYITMVEKSSVQYKLLKNKQNISKTADSMKCHRATVYDKLKTLYIPYQRRNS